MVFLLFLLTGPAAPAQEYAPQKVLPVAIRAITDPKIVDADKAKVAGNDLVIGVEIDGQARAYPINQLTGPSREIINDELAGTAIAATW
jgi:hypothetical protein